MLEKNKDELKIGVFLCKCGGNISEKIDPEEELIEKLFNKLQEIEKEIDKLKNNK